MRGSGSDRTYVISRMLCGGCWCTVTSA